MSSKILIKRSTTTGAIPTTADLDTGEFAVNTVDKRIFTNNQGTIVELGTTPSTQAVAGNATVGGTLAVTGATTLSTGSTTGNFSVAGTLQLDTEGTASNHVVTKAYVDTAISDLVDGAGSALDTLKELADAINNDANFATTITNSIATKLSKSGDTMTGNLNMGSNKVTSSTNPTADDDLTRKGYVDTILGSATAAATSASEAATSASNAATSEANASASATSASSSASSASSSATSASASATSASTSASSASTSASQASTSASNAATSATNAENAFDSFDDRYLGAKASDPTLDNDGDALLEGALYFNTTNDRMFVYTGSAWSAVSDVEALYNSGNLKLQTTATGVDVTGTVTADGLTVDGGGTIEVGSGGFNGRLNFPYSGRVNIDSDNNGTGEKFTIGSNQTGDGATNQIAVFRESGNVEFYEDTGTTAKFVWDSSAESLGIGTASPAAKLDVNGDISVGSGSTISWGGAWGAGIPAITGLLGGLRFYPNGSTSGETMRIDSSGNVGIGTSSPASDLHISSSTAKITLTDSDVSRTSEIYATSDNLVLAADTGNAGADSHIRFEVDNSEKMRVNSSGNVGIGTTGNLYGTTGRRVLNINGTSSVLLGLNLNDSPAGYLYHDGSNLELYNDFSGSLKFFNNGTERARIDSGGRLLIGTTSGNHTHNKGVRIVSNEVGSHVLDAALSIEGGAGDFYPLNFTGPSNTGFGVLAAFSPGTDYLMWQYRSGGSSNNLFSVNASGDVNINGSLSKSSGSFKIDHPLPEKTNTHHLVHSFVESPTADNIYRGKVNLVNGQATVNIDQVAGMTEGTFVALNREVQCFTSNESGWTNVKGYVSGNTLTIQAQDGTCSDTVSWLVIGERHDSHMYGTNWTDDNGKVIVEPLKQQENN